MGADLKLTIIKQVDIVRRLLRLAKAGKLGSVECDPLGEPNARVRLGAKWEPGILHQDRTYQPITWRQAEAIADKWVDPKPMKRESVAASTKPDELSPGARNRKRA